MTLALVTLQIRDQQQQAFEADWPGAERLLAGLPGCQALELRRSRLHARRYLLLIDWTARHTPDLQALHGLRRHFEHEPDIEHYDEVGLDARARLRPD